jgi:hypothetical protein
LSKYSREQAHVQRSYNKPESINTEKTGEDIERYTALYDLEKPINKKCYQHDIDNIQQAQAQKSYIK